MTAGQKEAWKELVITAKEHLFRSGIPTWYYDGIIAMDAHVKNLEKVVDAARDALHALQNENVLHPGKYLAVRELLDAALRAYEDTKTTSPTLGVE